MLQAFICYCSYIRCLWCMCVCVCMYLCVCVCARVLLLFIGIVQRNWACLTWKSAIEIKSLLLTSKCGWNNMLAVQLGGGVGRYMGSGSKRKINVRVGEDILSRLWNSVQNNNGIMVLIYFTSIYFTRLQNCVYCLNFSTAFCFLCICSRSSLQSFVFNKKM